MPASKNDIITQLRREINLLQGFKTSAENPVDMGLGPIGAAFPNAVFPTGALHEFISTTAEDAAATIGFLAALAAPLMATKGACIWIGAKRKLFPPSLIAFGIEPHQVIFLDLKKEKEVLWAMEESLKCEGLAAIIGETPEISFTASRRLQLAVEQSRVTAFLMRHNPRNANPIASIARWRVSPLASEPEPGMPGLGFPRWKVELEKIRNGQPGIWQMEWSAGRFRPLLPVTRTLPQEWRRQTG